VKSRYSAHSDVGLKREINQDAFAVEPETTEATERLLVVCDGMGGHAAGEVASRLGTSTIVEHYRADSRAAPESLLETAFIAANQQIYTEGHGTMGTTGIAALIRDDHLHITNVGDSRAYLLRGGSIRQLSRDHSLVSDQVAAGLMTVEQARASSFRNVITRALGHLPELSVDHFVETLYAGDIVVLSTDGMHGLIEDEEILAAFGELPLTEAVSRLIALANQRGGPDNITIAAAQMLGNDDVPADSDAVAGYAPAATATPADSDDLAGYTPAEPAAPADYDDFASYTSAEPATPAEPETAATPSSEVQQSQGADPPERSLNRAGLVLALLLLLLMIGAGAFLLANPTSLSPTATAVPSTATIPAVTESR
jgi:protein phosphatase